LAACRDLPTELFFPAECDDDGAEAAKAVCRSCPVRRDCVAYALADPTLTGVWGASTEAQRRNRRRTTPGQLNRQGEPNALLTSR